jgi:6-phosphogluconate dehydrogenase
MSDKTGTAQIGVIGMAVMGSNLARNFASNGFRTAIFNRTWSKTEAVLAAHPEAGFIASRDLSRSSSTRWRSRAGSSSWSRPARAPTPPSTPSSRCSSPGDIVVDGGNAFFQDTRRREKALRELDLQLRRRRHLRRRDGRPRGPLDHARRIAGLLRSTSARSSKKISAQVPTASPAAPTSAPTAPATS